MKGSKAKRGQELQSAQVFLWSPQGRSFRESASGPLEGDLQKLKATPEARVQVRRYFEKHGFRVYEDDLGLTLTLEAPRDVFVSVFDVDRAKLDANPLDQPPLKAPAELAKLIDQIVLSAAPEFFSKAP